MNPKYIRSELTEELHAELPGKFWLVHTANCEDGLIRRGVAKDEIALLESMAGASPVLQPISEYGKTPTFTGPFEKSFEARNYRLYIRERAS